MEFRGGLVHSLNERRRQHQLLGLHAEVAIAALLSAETKAHGRGRGVGRGLGVGVHLPAHGVGVGVTVGVGVGVGAPDCVQYLPPVLSRALMASPPQTIISVLVHTAV